MEEFERIYRDYFLDVYLYMKSLSNDEQIAQDITSETFIKAIGAINSFNGNCDIRSMVMSNCKKQLFFLLT